MRFDLHTHSTFSDGTTTPSEIVTAAKAIGLAGIALTDHDTTQGWDEARQAALIEGLDFLPGIELTTTHSWKSVHLLAYGLNVAYDPLQDRLQFLRDSRRHRAQEMVRRLRRDFVVDWDALLAEAEHGGMQSVGRPHLADALVQAGYFTDRSHAFEHALSPQSHYYVPTETLETIDAIALVDAAGGVSVLAHPAALRQRSPFPVDTLATLAHAGLGGIETRHPENRTDWILPLQNEAERLGLIQTGASDYHGAGKVNKLGEATTGLDVVSAIRERVHTPR